MPIEETQNLVLKAIYAKALARKPREPKEAGVNRFTIVSALKNAESEEAIDYAARILIDRGLVGNMIRDPRIDDDYILYLTDEGLYHAKQLSEQSPPT